MPLSSSPQPLVSIVTPAYNEEDHVAECIESVLAQSYTHWEYLIVNNCSTDGTLAIAREYAARDSRIRVVSNSTFLPAVANFNAALRQTSLKSKYCKIVFADDWIFPECLERMVALAEANPSVGIVGAYGHQGKCVLWQGLPYIDNVVSGREICRQRLLGGPYVFGTSTSVLYRSDIVWSHDPFYNESNAHAADSEACFELLKECDFGFIHQVLSFSRVRSGSLLEASRELNASAADTLRELVVYGPYYFTPEEYMERLDAMISKYYEYLAASLLGRRDRKFWNFHKQKLKENGIRFSWIELASAFARRLRVRLNLRSNEVKTRWGL